MFKGTRLDECIWRYILLIGNLAPKPSLSLYPTPESISISRNKTNWNLCVPLSLFELD